MKMISMLDCMKMIGIIGSVTAIIYFFKNYCKMLKTDEAEYHTVSILAFIDGIMLFMSYILYDINNDKTYIVLATLCLLTGCILLIDVVFFATKRVKKNQDEFYAITVLEEVGISYHSFKKLSFNEQLQLLKNTPCKIEGVERMLIEDEDDLMIFDCIMNKKANIKK